MVTQRDDLAPQWYRYDRRSWINASVRR